MVRYLYSSHTTHWQYLFWHKHCPIFCKKTPQILRYDCPHPVFSPKHSHLSPFAHFLASYWLRFAASFNCLNNTPKQTCNSHFLINSYSSSAITPRNLIPRLYCLCTQHCKSYYYCTECHSHIFTFIALESLGFSVNRIKEWIIIGSDTNCWGPLRSKCSAGLEARSSWRRSGS